MNWTVTLPCTRAEAEVMTGDLPALGMIDPAPVIVAREPVESDAAPSPSDPWEVIAYFETKPKAATIKLIQAQIPSARQTQPIVARLPDTDWVTMSQQGLAPVQAGRFYVHTDAHRGAIPASSIAFEIPASRAFGTGGHATTAGCLTMIDAMRVAGHAPRYIADIGTGTGLLAFAALALWPSAQAIATDIDPVSIDVVAENAVRNAIPLGMHPGQIALAVANGTDCDLVQECAPFDLVIANILAGPLMDLAPSLAEIIAPGGRLILAGLLEKQRADVEHAYRQFGMMPIAHLKGEWPVLHLRKRPCFGWKRPARATGRSRQREGDFGSW